MLIIWMLHKMHIEQVLYRYGSNIDTLCMSQFEIDIDWIWCVMHLLKSYVNKGTQ